MTNRKTRALTRQTSVGKVISLLFLMFSRLVIVFLPRSKHLLISWLQSLCAVILEPKKINSVTISIVSQSICHKVMGPDAMILVFWMFSFKPAFPLSSFTFIKSFFSSSSLSDTWLCYHRGHSKDPASLWLCTYSCGLACCTQVFCLSPSFVSLSRWPFCFYFSFENRSHFWK